MSINRRALGRGLAALIPAAAGPTSAPAQPDGESTETSPSRATSPPIAGRPVGEAREGLRVVGIEEVHPARSQPRKTFDDAKTALAAFIETRPEVTP